MKADLEAKFIDPFPFRLRTNNLYGFPSFSLIGQCLRKIQEDKSTGAMVVQNWPSQTWYFQLLYMTISTPKRLPKQRLFLRIPGKAEIYNHCTQIFNNLLAAYKSLQLPGISEDTTATVMASWR